MDVIYTPWIWLMFKICIIFSVVAIEVCFVWNDKNIMSRKLLQLILGTWTTFSIIHYFMPFNTFLTWLWKQQNISVFNPWTVEYENEANLLKWIWNRTKWTTLSFPQVVAEVLLKKSRNLLSWPYLILQIIGLIDEHSLTLGISLISDYFDGLQWLFDSNNFIDECLKCTK